VIKSKKDLSKIKKKGLAELYPNQIRIAVGTATCGLAAGAGAVYDKLLELSRKSRKKVEIAATGCLGLCQKEPLVDVYIPQKGRVIYSGLTPKKTEKMFEKIIEGVFPKGNALFYFTEDEFILTGEKYKYPKNGIPPGLKPYDKYPFYSKQLKIALRNCGFINPESIEHYIARDGYFGIAKILEEKQDPWAVIDDIKKSGLRGRGGGGFPAGRKWASCRKAKGDHYIICNADEGDPGAYMDRSICEGDPHSVIEGMMIGAYAIGAKKGFIYVREEYPLAVKNLSIALKDAYKEGLLGKKILGTDFDFDIQLNRGAGAFVCGESTALMASLEGKIGEPRAKYIHTVEHGYKNQPSNLNNVETWNNVPAIIMRGADWFSSIGIPKSTGTKVFSLVGKIENSGLIEVPMGITLKEIIYDIGGGIQKDKGFKSTQTGGPSGGCLPKDSLDLSVDFDTLTEAGSMMGSGGLIVMDENTCMVDVARYFTNFLAEESCGRCIPCREGLFHMLKILNDICEGKGTKGHIEQLEELSKYISDASLCALGGSAPNPVASTLRYFREEYEAHITDKKCPAGVCKELIEYEITDACTGCTLCVKSCPSDCITGKKDQIHEIDKTKCIKCGACFEVCNFDAVIRI